MRLIHASQLSRGYDAMAPVFNDWTRRIKGDPRLEWLDLLVDCLPDDARVLELGCGSGEPCTLLLSERFRVTGVDVSRAQLDLARAHAQRAELIEADLLSAAFDNASFDAVCSFYVLNHILRGHLSPLVHRCARWLTPGGWFMHAFATRDNPGWTGEWLGVEMFFSGYSPAENRRLVEAAGLTIARDELVTFTEPQPEPGDVTFQWLLARKNSNQNDASSAGWAGRVRCEDAGSTNTRLIGATDDDAACRPGRPDDTRLHFDSSSKPGVAS